MTRSDEADVVLGDVPLRSLLNHQNIDHVIFVFISGIDARLCVEHIRISLDLQRPAQIAAVSRQEENSHESHHGYRLDCQRAVEVEVENVRIPAAEAAAMLVALVVYFYVLQVGIATIYSVQINFEVGHLADLQRLFGSPSDAIVTRWIDFRSYTRQFPGRAHVSNRNA